MKVLKVVGVVFWVLGTIGLVVGVIDMLSGVEPQGVLMNFVMLILGVAAHGIALRKQAKKRTSSEGLAE